MDSNESIYLDTLYKSILNNKIENEQILFTNNFNIKISNFSEQK